MFSVFKSSKKAINKAYFSPGTDCQQAIISAIENAQNSIKICVFTISDDQITNAILKAHWKNINIRILTDNEKLFDLGSDIRQLAQAGIAVRTDNTRNHMHHKFALIDNELLITGSYNWTRSAALYNHENVIVSNSKELVQDFLVEFNSLWPEMTIFESN
ncbi:phospholipase D-like domain-containing protein [Adhaeribacter terreus]|uniref:phospholipase D n=1 Tax=Adhaeribacter terreus TaxID=529703 RepID=A0ABW0E6I5_9BACT